MNIIQRTKIALSFLLGKTLTGDQWKKGGIFGFSSNQGAQVPFRDSSLVYVACSKISENLPQAPLEFFNLVSKTRLGIESPIVRLFLRPNESSTYYTFFEDLTLYLALYGETFIWIGESVGQRVGSSSIPGQLVPLLPTRMQHIIDENGKLVGWTYDTGKERVSLTTDEVLQIKFPNPFSPFRGLAPIDSVKPEVDADYLAGKYSRSFFQNGANPGIVFTLNDDDESSREQRESFLKEWDQYHKGASEQYKTAILNAGMDAKKIGLTQEEMDYIKQRNFNTERILSVWGVPPPVAGFYEQATYGNVRTAKKIFWNETIKSYARRYESSLNNFFLPIYAPGTVCKFNFSDIDELKHDAKETADIVNIYANHGIPMNVLIEAFELPFDAQSGLDVGFQPMTMLEVGTSFLDVTNSNSKEVINVTPSAFDEVKRTQKLVDFTLKKHENGQLLDRFSKNLHNYLYRQREKVLKQIAKEKDVDDIFWKQENSRLVTKFEPIYAEYGKKADNLVSINTFNRTLVEKITSNENGDAPEKIRQLYNKFDSNVGNMKESRVSAISQKEIDSFVEHTLKV